MPLLDPRLKELLICPACGGELAEDEAASLLRCQECKRGYPVREFPIMMIENDTIEDGDAENDELIQS